jgi:hypothetical protein
MHAALTFYEFIAGGGMARLGLGDGWRCVLANDIDPMKGRAYAENFGRDHLRVCDVAKLTADDLSREAVGLCWMSPHVSDTAKRATRRGSTRRTARLRAGMGAGRGARRRRARPEDDRVRKRRRHEARKSRRDAGGVRPR